MGGSAAANADSNPSVVVPMNEDADMGAVASPFIPTNINTHDCPKCGGVGRSQKSHVYHGTFRRDRKCVCGHNFGTIEVQIAAPAAIFSAIEWATKDVLDPDMLAWLKYTVSKHLIGIVDPEDR